MSEQQNQISVLAGALVTHQRRFSKMPTEDRQWAIQNTEEAIGLFAEAVKNRNGKATETKKADTSLIAPNGIELPEGTVIRRTRVDPMRTPQEVIAATGRKPYVNDCVLATMPQSEGGEIDVYFLPTKRFMPMKEVTAFLAQYGLVSNPRAQASANEDNPAFADKYPNGSQWGNNCYLTFGRWSGDRGVRCRRDDGGWSGGWFLSGVPASRN